MRIDRSYRFLSLVLAVVSAGVPTLHAAAEPPPWEPAEVTGFFDQLLDEQMSKWHVPGAVVALVRDGSVVLAQGYGLADVESGRRVDAEETVFHVASIAKPVTAAAVLRLWHDGRLDLDADVNRYLRCLEVEEAFGRPVTAAHLLTHTAGFEDRIIARKTRRAEELGELCAHLAERLPARALPPGEVSSYSNYGYALAGLLVEEISGTPFADHMRDTLFRPLGMHSSAYGLPPDLAPRRAVGYRGSAHGFQALPLDYIRTVPASMLFTTGSDMARFLLAVLGDPPGVADPDLPGNAVLPESVRTAMHQRRFEHHPELPGRSLGWSESDRGAGQRTLVHSGGTTGFSSGVVVVPEERVALFVAFNGYGSVWETIRRFLATYLPAPQREPEPIDRVAVSAARFAGSYRSAGFSRTTIEKLGTLMRQRRLEAAGKGEWRWGRTLYRAVSPLELRPVDGGEPLVFRDDGDGAVRYLFSSSDAYEKLAWYESRNVQAAVFLSFTVLFLGFGVARPLAARIARRGEASWPWARRWTSLAALANLIFLVALAAVMVRSSGPGGGALQYGVPPFLPAILALPWISIGCGVAAGMSLLRGRERSEPSNRSRAWDVVALVSLAAFLPLLVSWNLLGWNY